MSILRTIILILSLVSGYLHSEELVKTIDFNNANNTRVSIVNYHDNGEPICDLKIVDNNSKTDRYMFDSCGNLELSEIDKENFKFEVINYRGNQKKIVYTDASFSILGIINVDLSDNSTEIIENNFKCIPSIIGLDAAEKNILDKFKSH
ncbi:hypothetical protein [Vibrio cholerae]|uniref:hypothetical protein n=1 Tax=Vibrio cholerae TaxID=666 RepID=UPI001C30F099